MAAFQKLDDAVTELDIFYEDRDKVQTLIDDS